MSYAALLVAFHLNLSPPVGSTIGPRGRIPYGLGGECL